MSVPVTPWSSWVDADPSLAEHRVRIAAAVEELRRRHPARRAFWGDDLAWELGATGLDATVADAVRRAARSVGPLRIGVNAEPPAVDRAPTSAVRSVLLASTPRSGNTIVRRMLGQLGLTEYALHDLDDLFWSAATRPFVVQHHIAPSERSLAFLDEQQAAVVTAVRHPLDVLCSVRAFSQREPACRYWLDGAVGLTGVDLADDASFLAWATGAGADALLDVSTRWAGHPGAVVVRHEDVVTEPAMVFHTLAGTVGVVVDDAGAEERYADASGGIPAVHRTSAGPGAWESLPAPVRSQLAARHRRHLDALGYDAG